MADSNGSWWDVLDRGGEAIADFGGHMIDLYDKYKSTDAPPPMADVPEREYEPTGDNWRDLPPPQQAGIGGGAPGLLVLGLLAFLVFQQLDD